MTSTHHTKQRVVVRLERDPAFEALTLGELRLVRQVLVDEVERVSYWRRVLGVQAGSAKVRRSPLTPVKEMQRALSDASRSPQRMSLVPGGQGEPKQLPDLVALYSHALGQGEHGSRDHLAQDLADADAALACYRSDLQDRVERTTTQIIVRYREAPALALLLLPPTEDASHWGGTPVHEHHDAGTRRGQRAW